MFGQWGTRLLVEVLRLLLEETTPSVVEKSPLLLYFHVTFWRQIREKGMLKLNLLTKFQTISTLLLFIIYISIVITMLTGKYTSNQVT